MNFKLYAVLVAFVVMAFASTTFAASIDQSSASEQLGKSKWFFWKFTHTFVSNSIEISRFVWIFFGVNFQDGSKITLQY